MKIMKNIFLELRLKHNLKKAKMYLENDSEKAKRLFEKAIGIIYKRKNEFRPDVKLNALESFYMGMSKIMFKERNYAYCESYLMQYIYILENKIYSNQKNSLQKMQLSESSCLRGYLEVQILRKKLLKMFGNTEKIKEVDNNVLNMLMKLKIDDNRRANEDVKSEKEENNTVNQIKENSLENNVIEKKIEITEVKNRTELKEDSENVENQAKMKAQLEQILEKYNKMDFDKKYKNGKACSYIKCLIDYLKEYNDCNIEELLNQELTIIDEIVENANIKQFRIYENININILIYMSEIYKEGIRSMDNSRILINNDLNKHGYFLFLANKTICQYEVLRNNELEYKKKIEDLQENKTNKSEDIYEEQLKNLYIQYLRNKTEKNKWNIDEKKQEKIKQDFIDNQCEMEYRYFNYLEKKKNSMSKNGIEKLLSEAKFMAECSGRKYNTQYADFKLALLECTRIPTENSKKKIIELENSLINDINNKKRVEYRTLEVLGDIFYNGIKTDCDELVIKPNKLKAETVYSFLINEYSDKKNSMAYSNLLRIYNDKTLPVYDCEKVLKISNYMKENGISYQKELIKEAEQEQDNKSNIFVCSDIHGEKLIYDTIVQQLRDEDKLYILGDVIDRGEDGIEILQDISRRKGQVEFFIGNHEFELFQYNIFQNLEENPNLIYEELEKGNTERKTFNDLKKLSQTERNKIKEFLLNSLIYKQIDIEGDNVYLVHARALQDEKENQKTLKEMIEENKMDLVKSAVCDRGGDSCEYGEIGKEGVLTIIGHSPTEGKIMFMENCIDIDCGSSYRGNRNQALVCLNTGKVKYFNYDNEREKTQIKSYER